MLSELELVFSLELLELDLLLLDEPLLFFFEELLVVLLRPELLLRFGVEVLRLLLPELLRELLDDVLTFGATAVKANVGTAVGMENAIVAVIIMAVNLLAFFHFL